MKNGDLAQYVDEMEKHAFVKSLISGAKEVGRAISSTARGAKNMYDVGRGIGLSRKTSLRIAGSTAKHVGKGQWKMMSSTGKGMAIGAGVTGLAAGGYGLKKILGRKKKE